MAARLFRRKGFAAVTMREIGEAVGLSKAGLYHHCPSKEGLLAEVAHYCGDLLLDQLRSVSDLQKPARDRLWRLVISRMAVIVKNRDLFAVFWQERPLLTGKAFADVAKAAELYRAGVRRIIEEAQRNGDVRKELDPHLLMLAIDGMTGWACLWFRDEGGHDPEGIAEAFWSFLADGIFAAGAPAHRSPA